MILNQMQQEQAIPKDDDVSIVDPQVNDIRLEDIAKIITELKELYNKISSKVSKDISQEIVEELKEEINSIVIIFDNLKKLEVIADFIHTTPFTIEDLKKDVYDIKNQLSNLVRDISEINTLKLDLSEIKGKLSHFTSGIERCTSRFDLLDDKLDKKFSDLNNKLDTKSTEVGVFKEKISKVEGKLSTNSFLAVTSFITIVGGFLAIFIRLIGIVPSSQPAINSTQPARPPLTNSPQPATSSP